MAIHVYLDDTTRVIGLGKGGEIEVDVIRLAEHDAVINYIFNYGLKQMLNDVHASEKDAKAKWGLSQKKLDSLYRGEVAQARATTSGDRIEREMQKIAVEVLKAKLPAVGTSWGKLAKEAQTKLVARYLETHGDEARKIAEVRLAAANSAKDSLSLEDLGL